MAKTRVEICLISARGLQRSSSLWKLQWFAVGWIDPKSKYCTKIDTSGSTNPTWRTKFSALIDDSESNSQGLALHVQVYSRDSIFLREKLQGTAVVMLKEFLTIKKSEANGVEQLGSFQLRKNSSGKAQGFVDVSIRISEEDHKHLSSYPGNGEGFHLTGEANDISFGAGSDQYSSRPYLAPPNNAETYPQPHMTSAYNPHPISNHAANPSSVSGSSNRLSRTPPPPPPPSHVGYLPTFLPRDGQLPGNWVNIPSSSSSGTVAGRGGASNFGMGMGMGAGALAAGAVIFGDDFMTGFELPSALQDDSLIISVDPPF
ncbi:Calcium-dependent lipid-binding (CaLB domain) family protein [Thalictrum thalictroides]|uniref:Calcium-dependent lipid-binding (CaLB domain) family protein n=1 Tax=Thalictrum thalictroides TaxID=46969 RepID=A0A7J6WXE0_THATH|nr:Calcium-dependent lipid-binding (CaLB domain) family protein [Thalictrum thalictroides]